MNISLMSSLFSGGQSQTGIGLFGNLTNSLGDYAMIRSGTYGKLMRAYYKEVVNEKKTSSKTQPEKKQETEQQSEQMTTSVSSASAKVLAETKSDAKALESAANDLQDKKIYEKKVVTAANGTKEQEYDRKSLGEKVDTFVKNYNDMIDCAQKSTTGIIKIVGKSMQTQTKMKQNGLEKIGISIGADNKLKVDEETLKKADIADIKAVFQGKNSYGEKISSLASDMASNANYEASKANTYTTKGTYSYNHNAGTLFQGII